MKELKNWGLWEGEERESRAGVRTDLVGVDLVELLDQVDDAGPDGALGVRAVALLARRRAHPPRKPALRHRSPPTASMGSSSNGLRAEPQVLQHQGPHSLHALG